MADSQGFVPAQSNSGGDDRIVPARQVALGGDQVGRLSAALADALTGEDLRCMLATGLDGNLSLRLEDVVATENRTLSAICHSLVRWALQDKRVGLSGLLAAALRTNATNHQLLELQQEWAGVTFTAPACPYLGMKPFTAADQGRFYGREAEIQQAVDQLRRHPFLAIIGPSGSGKSSLVAAGVLPALEKSHFFADKRWIVRTMRPGAAPFATLAPLLDLSALFGVLTSAPNGLPGSLLAGGEERFPNTSAGTRLLLVVDQFEELYTIAGADQRQQFDQALLQFMSLPGCFLLIAARADFYANLMASPLWPQIREHRLEITPPRGDALRQAIAQPARDVGVQLDPDLVERLLADAGEEPGVLPFIQETLVMLWVHADRFVIGLDAYTDLVGDKSGRSGLQIALAEHAEHVYRDVLADDAERALAQRILLRLIQFGEGRPDTRRQQTEGEVRRGSGPANNTGNIFDKVLAALTANRLVTLSGEERLVDLSHEALIRGWPRLHEWIDARRAAELTRRRLEEKAAERLRLRQADEASGLLDAVELAEAETWVKGPDAAELGVSSELAALIADSRQAIDTAALEKEAAARRELEQARQLAAERTAANQGLQRRALIAYAIGLIAMLAAAVAVFYFIKAQENLSLAQQKLDELKVEELLKSARDKKDQIRRDGCSRRLQRCCSGCCCQRQGAGRFRRDQRHAA